MRDYNTNKHYNGYKSAPEVVLLAVILGYLVVNTSWEQITLFFTL